MVNGVRAARSTSTIRTSRAKDVSAIISWMATQPEVQLDNPDTLDPRIGMVRRLVRRRHPTGDRRQSIHRESMRSCRPSRGTASTPALDKDEALKSQLGHLCLRSLALIGTDASVNPRIYPAPDLRPYIDGHSCRPDDQQLRSTNAAPTELVEPDHRADLC